MGAGEISIQRQRMLAFGDALRRAFGQYVDKPRHIWPRAWSGTEDKALVNFRFGRREGRRGIGHKEMYARVVSARADPIERVDIVGIGGERAIEKAARLRHVVGGQTLVEPSQTLKIEVHRVGVRSLFRASRLGGDELGVQRARQARDDFVLHVEEIGERLVEPLGPEMTARFGVDELHIDAHAVSAALDAAFEDIADVQLAADLLQIDGLALVGEGRVAPDHERASNARKIGRQALRDPIDEMLLLRVAADIGERQDHHREARRGGFFGRDGRAALARRPTSSE